MIPSDITGLQVWLKEGHYFTDAGKSTPCVADSDLIYTWEDTKNSNDYQMATSSYRPEYITPASLPIDPTRGAPGFGALKIPGTSSQKYVQGPGELTVFTAAGPKSIAALVYITGAMGSPRCSFGGGLGSGYAGFTVFTTGASANVLSANDDGAADYRTCPGAPVTGRWYVVFGIHSSGTLYAYDDTDVVTGASISSGNTTGTKPLCVGIQSATGTANALYVAESMIWSSALTQTERQGMVDYLFGKWFPTGGGYLLNVM